MAFIIDQKIDMRQENEHKVYGQPLEYGDKNAHEWRVVLRDGGKKLDMTGLTAMLTFKRAAGPAELEQDPTIRIATVEYPAIVDAASGVAWCTFQNACYGGVGNAVATMKLMDGDTVLTSAVLIMSIQRNASDAVIDPTNMLPSVDELLAQMGAMKTATDAANEAADAATAAAQEAEEQAKEADEAVTEAKKAVEDAQAALRAVEGWIDAEMTVEMLDAGEEPSAGVLTEEDGHKVIVLQIPRGETGATPLITFEVATGDPGTQVQVAQSGTAENPVIHLTIPRGDTGKIDGLNYYEGTPAAPGEAAAPGSSDAVSRGDHVHPLQTSVSGNAGTATKLQTARKIGDASFDGSADITLKQIGAYPAAGIRVLEVSLPAASWTGGGPYTLEIAEESVTENTDCRFEFGSTQTYIAADIDWETTAGTIMLSTTAKPTGELAGRVILMEVSS